MCHGDLKCENALVTSWDWLFLADFATHKPTYLPADNPVRHTRQSSLPDKSTHWGMRLRRRLVCGHDDV